MNFGQAFTAGFPTLYFFTLLCITFLFQTEHEVIKAILTTFKSQLLLLFIFEYPQLEM